MRANVSQFRQPCRVCLFIYLQRWSHATSQVVHIGLLGRVYRRASETAVTICTDATHQSTQIDFVGPRHRRLPNHASLVRSAGRSACPLSTHPFLSRLRRRLRCVTRRSDRVKWTDISSDDRRLQLLYYYRSEAGDTVFIRSGAMYTIVVRHVVKLTSRLVLECDRLEILNSENVCFRVR